MLDSPSGVAIAADGTFYIADVDNNRIRRVSSVAGEGITTVTVGSALSSPVAVAIDPTGEELYIADLINQRIVKVDFTP